MDSKPVPACRKATQAWTSLAQLAQMTKIRFIENGRCEARCAWSELQSDERPLPHRNVELTWNSDSRALIWRIAQVVRTGASPGKSATQSGFRSRQFPLTYLPSIAASKVDYNWPNGPDDEEPPNHDVAPRNGHGSAGHVIYYHHAENYGALGIVALDTI